MKKICTTLFFCFAGFSLLSQTSKIENTEVRISSTGDTMYIKYDLKGKREASNITLEVKDQNNRIIQPKNISGDIGKNIQPGNEKIIIWDMNADGLDLSGSSLKVKVKGDVFIPAEKKIKYPPSKWGCAVELFSGYGIFTDDLTKTYRNTIPFGAAGDFYYKRLALYLRDYIGFSKIIRDVPYSDGNWAKGSQVRIFILEASLGYVLTENKTFKVTPFAGFALTDISPTKSDLDEIPELSQVELEFTSTYLLGLNLDFKISPSKTPLLSAELGRGYLFIRLRYSYNITQFDNKYTGFSGNIHSITIGIGGLGTRFRAKY